MNKRLFDDLMKQVIEETIHCTDIGNEVYTCNIMKDVFFVYPDIAYDYTKFIRDTEMVDYTIDDKYGDSDEKLLPLRIFLLTSFALDYQSELE